MMAFTKRACHTTNAPARRWFHSCEKIFAAALALATLLTPVAALANATTLPNGKTQFFDGTGVPLANGQVFFFIAGTSTPATTWQDPAQSIQNPNPVILDSNGMAVIWGAGNYREVVLSAAGALIWDQQTNQLAGVVDEQNSAYQWGSLATGNNNSFNISLSPSITTYTAGLTVRFISNQTTNGPVQLNVNNVGLVPLTKFGSNPLVNGDIVNGELVQAVYDGTQFEMTSVPGSIPTTPGLGLQANAGTWSVNPAIFQGALGGLQLSNDGTSPNTTIDISSGYATSDDVTAMFTYVSAATKTTTSTFLVGSGNGCLDAGTVAPNLWYHVFAIARLDTGVADFLCSLSPTAPALPANYTVKRRLGSFATDGASNIKAFKQNGDEFIWSAPVADIATTTLGVTGTLFTFGGFPGGLKFNVLMRCNATNVGAFAVLLTSPDESDVAPNATAGNTQLQGAAGVTTAAQLSLRSNTSQQLRARSTAASTTLNCATYGYIDTRGRFN